jgi:hypothetical protein
MDRKISEAFSDAVLAQVREELEDATSGDEEPGAKKRRF